MQGFLFENAKIISAVVPINQTGAAQTGLWVKMSVYNRCEIIIQQGAWAGGTSAVTVNQATDNSGTGSKAVAFPYVYRGLYGQSGTGVDQLVKVTVTSNTFNLSTANQYFVIPIHAQDMDINNSFLWLSVGIASPGANADLVNAIYVMTDGSYRGLPSTIPSVI